MSPLRQQILDAIDRTSDENLGHIAHALRSIKTLPAMPPADLSETWQSITIRLKNFTIEQQNQQRQAVSELLRQWETEEDAEEHAETWAFLQTALDCDRLSDRPLFP